MSEMTITLRCDPVTYQREIVVTLRADEDLLPNEREQLHKRLVDKLIDGGLLNAGEASPLVIERVADQHHSELPTAVEDTPSGGHSQAADA